MEKGWRREKRKEPKRRRVDGKGDEREVKEELIPLLPPSFDTKYLR